MNPSPIWLAMLLAVSLAAHAAEPQAQKAKPAQAPIVATAASAPASGAAGSTGPLTKKYCCSSPSGKACYVFGSASCSNCNTFCNGQIVIQ
jgi:hypothetical protein